jgi:hypothetical protein
MAEKSARALFEAIAGWKSLRRSCLWSGAGFACSGADEGYAAVGREITASVEVCDPDEYGTHDGTAALTE